MDLNELQTIAEKDLKVDDLELGDESLKTATLHQKYLNIYNNFRQLHLMNEGTYNVLRRKKWEYYSGKADPDVYIENPFPKKVRDKDTMQKYLDADERLSGVSLKIDYYDTMLVYIESILKQVSNRTYHIKNAIEFMRFNAGLG